MHCYLSYAQRQISALIFAWAPLSLWFNDQVPFGIAQIGKAFRNEITPRNFVFRSREFEQMEIEYFIPPEDDVWPQVRSTVICGCFRVCVAICLCCARRCGCCVLGYLTMWRTGMYCWQVLVVSV
jgi:hypothetical protein